MALDFIAVGDTTIDDFIRLKEASVHCDIDSENCTISMRWGDKIPFESSTIVYGVGNAANAAVSAKRLGLSTGFVSNVGADERGELIIKSFQEQEIDATEIRKHPGVPTNYHYVLSYESERTILIKHEKFAYSFPMHLEPPKALYLSSLGEHTEAYHDEIAEYAEKHPDMFLAFQPGSFQMRLGVERLSRLYKRANFVVLNKQEAQFVLGSKSDDVRDLMDGMLALGPKIVAVTDGRNGAHATDGTSYFRVPLYPDPRPPKERTGAGDAFASTVTVALLYGKPLSEALLWGPVNSMSVVQKVGAQEGLLTKDALLTYIERAPDYKATPF